MKKTTMAIAFAIGTSITTPAFAGDACATVLCMFGMLKGADASSECSGPVSDYFSIVKKKKGKIKLNPTSAARMDFLNQCSSADSGAKKDINKKFGKVI